VANGTTYQFNVRETDLAGNTSAATSNFEVTGDTSAPTANFTAATDNVGTVTGALTSSDTTDDTALVLSGTNESGSSVEVLNGSIELGAATISGTSWSYSATVANGTTYQFNVKETDLAGNTSAATSNFTVTGDTTAPTAPSVSGTTPTTDTTPTWSWSSGGGGNGTYRYKLDSSDLTSGATTTTSTSYAPVSAISEGSRTLYVQERDPAGNWSSSGSRAIVIDTTAPTFTFYPDNGTTGVATSVNITITFSEPVRLLNNAGDLTDSNIDSLDLITLLYPNVGPNLAIDFDATINDNKTIITINPTSSLQGKNSINVAIGATVEDYVGHAITASNATFQTP
jgi:hypothetical protein